MCLRCIVNYLCNKDAYYCFILIEMCVVLLIDFSLDGITVYVIMFFHSYFVVGVSRGFLQL